MTEEEHKRATNAEGDERLVREPGKDKILIQCLDTSGSMAGAPLRNLQAGALQIGERFFKGEKRPFERFYTLDYDSQMKETLAENHEQYKEAISQLKAGGQTNFMIVFQRVLQIIESLPKTKEVAVIFITDGEDTVYANGDPVKMADLGMIGMQIKTRPNLKSRFMTIGFSRDHNAQFMNEITGYGTDQGNFVFVDQREDGYQEKFQAALVEALELAMGPDTDI